jgi:hypothetical protein
VHDPPAAVICIPAADVDQPFGSFRRPRCPHPSRTDAAHKDKYATDVVLRQAGGLRRREGCAIGYQACGPTAPSSGSLPTWRRTLSLLNEDFGIDRYRGPRAIPRNSGAACRALQCRPADSTTPAAMVTLLRAIWDGKALSPASRETLPTSRRWTGDTRLGGVAGNRRGQDRPDRPVRERRRYRYLPTARATSSRSLRGDSPRRLSASVRWQAARAIYDSSCSVRRVPERRRHSPALTPIQSDATGDQRLGQHGESHASFKHERLLGGPERAFARVRGRRAALRSRT